MKQIVVVIIVLAALSLACSGGGGDGTPQPWTPAKSAGYEQTFSMERPMACDGCWCKANGEIVLFPSEACLKGSK